MPMCRATKFLRCDELRSGRRAAWLRLHRVVAVCLVHTVEELPEGAGRFVGRGNGAVLLFFGGAVLDEQLALDAAVLDVGRFVHREERNRALVAQVVEPVS